MFFRLSFYSLLSACVLVSVGCGRDQADSRSQNTDSIVSSQGANARNQNQVVYCDDLIPNSKSNLPHNGQDCMRSSDGEPIVDVRPGGTNPGQAPGYNNPNQAPRNPQWQNPNPSQKDPRYHQDPDWQTPGYQPADPTYPNNPQWQNPNNPGGNGGNNPQWQNPQNQNPNNNPQNQNPGFDGEPLPY